MEREEIISLLDVIETKMISSETLGFSPEVLEVLDNVEASNEEIELLKTQIGNEILMRIFNIANSAYFGTLKKGGIATFYEVVTRLGMSHTKVLIIIFALHALCQDDRELEIIFVRSYVSAVIGKILAQQLGFREDAAKKVELGGLLSEIGRILILLYKKLYAPEEEKIDDNFIDKYHPYLGERIVEIFALPDYLKEMIFTESIVVKEKYITISGVTQMAINIVGSSFHKHHNRFVLEALPSSADRDESINLDRIILDQFNAVGLGNFLRIIKKRERLLPEHEDKKEKE